MATALRTIHQRIITFFVTAVVVAASYVILEVSHASSSAELHTLFEVVAVGLAFFCGAMAMVRFYSQKNNTFLFLFTGFLGAAALDGFHALAMSRALAAQPVVAIQVLGPWTWLASRGFLAMFIYLGWRAWRREERLGERGRISEWWVYAGAISCVAACIAFFSLASPPAAYYPDRVFPRPLEIVPAAIFALALIGYASKGAWKRDRLESWLLLSLIVSCISEAFIMSRSGMPFDAMHDGAHVLKIVSYGLVLMGLLSNSYETFRLAENSVRRLQTVNDRLRDEIRLRKTLENKFRTIFESTPCGLFAANSMGVMVIVNAELPHLFGYDRSELIGRPVETLFPDEMRDRFRECQASFYANPEPRRIGIHEDLLGRGKNGDELAIEFVLAPYYEDRDLLVLGVIVDITERKQAQRDLRESKAQLAVHAARLERSNEELSQFAYVASHDLQEPLRKVASFCQIVKDEYGGSLDDTANSYLDFAVDGAARMKALVDGLLHFSRVDTQGRPILVTDTQAAFDTAVDNLQIVIEETDAEITCDPLPRVAADEPQLVQLFQNLLDNAIKFRGAAPPRVHVAVEGRADDWVFSVRDNGIGIERKYFARIFGVFKRLHGHTEYTGAGIGLAICQKIVDRFGGALWLESTPGAGSTFYFTLAKDSYANSLVGEWGDERIGEQLVTDGH